MHGTRLRILLVDDDEEDYLLTSGTIAEIPGMGYDVVWRDSFSGALEALTNGVFDVLVFDYRLGPETGIDLLKEVRAREYPAPVILLTGQQDSDLDNEAIRHGAADYLIKGKITADVFERSVRHAIHQHQILSQLHESNSFLQSIIDALTSEVAILNADGTILAVNRAWRDSFSPLENCGVGANYLTYCASALEEERENAEQLVAGIRGVMEATQESFTLDCPMSGGGDKCRWLTARVSSFNSRETQFIVVAFEDITARKLTEMQLEMNRAQLEELSVRDELTKLYNRRFFNSALDREIARATRQLCTFAVLLLDIDRFKSVNDTYGHQIGDEALKHVAHLCAATCRTSDCLARFGGEEIAFVVPEAGKEAALEFAERVRIGLERRPMVFEIEGKSVTLPITASFGVAVFPECGTTPEQLLAFSDKGLYAAKSAGRNRVCFGGN